MDKAAAGSNKLNKIVQLTGFSDPIYAEAYVTVRGQGGRGGGWHGASQRAFHRPQGALPALFPAAPVPPARTAHAVLTVRAAAPGRPARLPLPSAQVHQYDIVLDVTVTNRTSETMQVGGRVRACGYGREGLGVEGRGPWDGAAELWPAAVRAWGIRQRLAS